MYTHIIKRACQMKKRGGINRLIRPFRDGLFKKPKWIPVALNALWPSFLKICVWLFLSKMAKMGGLFSIRKRVRKGGSKDRQSNLSNICQLTTRTRRIGVLHTTLYVTVGAAQDRFADIQSSFQKKLFPTYILEN
jgi:hypothetical protein